MSERTPRGKSDRLDAEVVVRVLRLGEGLTETLRTLAASYRGLLTHWHKGRSYYCPGAELCNYHRLPTVWKGYTPIEVWKAIDCCWYPWVLEISENLDLDMKPRFDRGQVWEIERTVRKKKGCGAPVKGRLLEERDQAHFPEPFAMSAILRTLYNWKDIRLDQDNPLPPRTLVRPTRATSSAVAPVPTRPADAPSNDQYDRFRQTLSGAFAPPGEVMGEEKARRNGR